MANYKYSQFLTQSNETAFDTAFTPGVVAPYAGIYRCTGCGKEIAIAQWHHLPSQNHHEHSWHEGPIRWQLIAYADHNPK